MGLEKMRKNEKSYLDVPSRPQKPLSRAAFFMPLFYRLYFRLLI